MVDRMKLLATAAAVAIAAGTSAHAVVIDATDVGQTFSWTWAFTQGGENVSANGDLTLDSVVGSTWSWTAMFDNNADSGARITSWGFDLDPDATDFSLLSSPGGWSDGSGQGVMNVEHCAHVGPNCAGGGGGGITAGTQNATFTFSFDVASNSVDITNFLTRWQSVGTNDQLSNVAPGTPVPPGTPVIPLPAGLPLLIGGLAALGAVKRLKRKAA